MKRPLTPRRPGPIRRRISLVLDGLALRLLRRRIEESGFPSEFWDSANEAIETFARGSVAHEQRELERSIAEFATTRSIRQFENFDRGASPRVQ